MSTLAQKFINFVAAMATNVSASAFFASDPKLGAITLAVAAIAVTAESYLQAGSGKETETAITSRLQLLLQKTGTLGKAIVALAADAEMHEFVSAQRADAFLGVI